jgi:hypothetical protein
MRRWAMAKADVCFAVEVKRALETETFYQRLRIVVCIELQMNCTAELYTATCLQTQSEGRRNLDAISWGQWPPASNG